MAAGEELTDDRTLTSEEQANVEAIRRFVDLYNGDDMKAFVTECYHPDAKVTVLDGVDYDGREASISSHDTFIELESFIKADTPGRRIVVERTIAAGNTVTIEAVLADDNRPDFRLAWCGIYTFKDGLITSDHSYLNHRHWPGLLKAVGQA